MENKPRPIYAAYLLATQAGHKLLYTPPYHPELQPIELLWGAAKNKVSMNPGKNMDDLSEKLKKAFSECGSKTWIGSYRKAQSYEDKYQDSLERDEVLMYEEEEENQNDDIEEIMQLNTMDNNEYNDEE